MYIFLLCLMVLINIFDLIWLGTWCMAKIMWCFVKRHHNTCLNQEWLYLLIISIFVSMWHNPALITIVSRQSAALSEVRLLWSRSTVEVAEAMTPKILVIWTTIHLPPNWCLYLGYHDRKTEVSGIFQNTDYWTIKILYFIGCYF